MKRIRGLRHNWQAGQRLAAAKFISAPPKTSHEAHYHFLEWCAKTRTLPWLPGTGCSCPGPARISCYNDTNRVPAKSCPGVRDLPMKIVHYPHPALRFKSRPLTTIDEKVRTQAA